MQIGSRWGAGAHPHPSVPQVMLPTILEVDADGHSGSWTLTWLEGRPVCTRDDEVTVTINAEGHVQITLPGEHAEDDDSWLL